MIEIYTPEQWLSAFGGFPKLIVNDAGEIYSAKDYYKVLEGAPIGRIDYENGRIYGKDYASLSAAPIGYLEKGADAIKVYDRFPSLSAAPILYIQGDKVYTPEQYTAILGSDASAYINRKKRNRTPEDSEPSPGGPSGPGGSGGSGGSGGPSGSGSSGGFGGSLLKLGGLLLAGYCVIGGLSAAMPLWLCVLLAVLLVVVLAYKAFLAPKTDRTAMFKIAFFAVLIWYIIGGAMLLNALH